MDQFITFEDACSVMERAINGNVWFERRLHSLDVGEYIKEAGRLGWSEVVWPVGKAAIKAWVHPDGEVSLSVPVVPIGTLEVWTPKGRIHIDQTITKKQAEAVVALALAGDIAYEVTRAKGQADRINVYVGGLPTSMPLGWVLPESKVRGYVVADGSTMLTAVHLHDVLIIANREASFTGAKEPASPMDRLVGTGEGQALPPLSPLDRLGAAVMAEGLPPIEERKPNDWRAGITFKLGPPERCIRALLKGGPLDGKIVIVNAAMSELRISADTGPKFDRTGKELLGGARDAVYRETVEFQPGGGPVFQFVKLQ